MKVKTAIISAVFFLISFSAIAQKDSLTHIETFKLFKPVSKSIPNYSGDHQTQTARLKSDKPIRIQVLNNKNEPVKDLAIILQKFSSPEGDKIFNICDTLIYTDSLGIAEAYIVLGSKEGMYEISAQLS